MLRSDEIPGSPVIGPYRAVSPLLYMYLRVWDAALAPVGWLAGDAAPDPAASERPPRRVLVANCAHLGDVVLATSVLPVLKAAFPGVSIGFLCGGWSRQILEGHPLVDRVHTVDNWKLNRSEEPVERKLRRYLRTRRQAISEIRAEQYDVAIDLYYFYPNSADIFWAAGIPVRIGFTGGGFGRLYTHPVPYRYQPGRHVIDYHADMLLCLGVGNGYLANMRPELVGAPDAPPSLRCELGAHGMADRGYVLIHMGTGDSAKEWPCAKWSALTSRLHTAGHQMVFTGRGTRERRMVGAVAENLEGSVDLCDRLDISEFIATVERAGVVVAGDSLAAHVAAAVGTPSVVIAPGIDINSWWPVQANARLLTYPVKCTPCFVGCRGMECVRRVDVNDVHQAIEALVRESVPNRTVTE